MIILVSISICLPLDLRTAGLLPVATLSFSPHRGLGADNRCPVRKTFWRGGYAGSFGTAA
ncbi:DUF1964 domain-containing protein [Bradyrhizobium diazoefficiens]|nr:DUF1964 domain-containing protein [Bradyrhizobium diazoefficiens]